MALRLIDTSGDARPSVASSPSPDLEVLARGRAALARRDLDAYRACAADAAALDDPHRRYVVRRTLIELGMQAGQGAGADTASVLLAAGTLALEVLADSPAEPVLLNLAGVLLYELGGNRGAEALFKAARRLDHALPHVDRNLRELTRRRKGGVVVKLPPLAASVLPRLERRAASVAQRALPTAPQPISLCMIVKDEEEMLGRCLASVDGAVDEIVVVDTGSTDRTIAIAREHGARVIEHPWNDDFAEARNVGLDAATGEWILFLDADEVLVAEDAPKLRELTRRAWREAFTLTLTNFVGTESDGTAVTHDGLRLFRNRPTHRFDGRIHEGVLHALPADAPERTEAAGVRVEHFGYLRRTREAKDKSRRNLELLERQLEEGQVSAYVLYNLGSEHANLGEHATAIEHFGRAWEMLLQEPDPAAPGFAPSLVTRYVTALRFDRREDRAWDLAERGLELFPGFTDLVLEQAQIARSRGDRDVAEALLRRCLEMGDAPSRYTPTIGAGTFLAAFVLGALLVDAGRGGEAETLLLDTLAAHPRYLAVVEPLTDLLLRRGAEPADVVAMIAERSPLTPSVRFALGTGLHETGHAEAAAEQFAALLEQEPTAAPARLALAETLFSQRRWDDAADAAAAVEDGSPWAGAAAVSEGFGRLVAGDRAGTRAAAERAGRAGAPAHDQAVLRAWAGGPDPLPSAALALVITSLEALLRVEELEAFERQVPLLDRVEGLSRRACREVLASLYFRRGFVDSAADEWASACQESGPDAAALTGLARVAAARGDTDDARLFAEGALELDPQATDAGRVLAALAAA